MCSPEQSHNDRQKWPLWTQQCWPVSDLVNDMNHLSATSLTSSSQASVSMASYNFSKEFQMRLFLLLSHAIYLLLGELSLYEEETSNDDIPIEKLCENIYWEIAHLSLVVLLRSWFPQSKPLFNLITGNETVERIFTKIVPWCCFFLTPVQVCSSPCGRLWGNVNNEMPMSIP